MPSAQDCCSGFHERVNRGIVDVFSHDGGVSSGRMDTGLGFHFKQAYAWLAPLGKVIGGGCSGETGSDDHDVNVRAGHRA